MIYIHLRNTNNTVLVQCRFCLRINTSELCLCVKKPALYVLSRPRFNCCVCQNRAISEQKVRMKRLGTDLTSAQKEMKAKHKAYENAVGILSRRLQEALTDKETAEAELAKLRAQLLDGGNSQALQVKLTEL